MHLPVDGTVERAGFGGRQSAPRLCLAVEQNQLGDLIRSARLGEVLLPPPLHVVDDEPDEIDQLRVGIRRPGELTTSSVRSAGTSSEDTGAEQDDQQDGDHQAADPAPHGNGESAAAAAKAANTLATTVFDLIAAPAASPPHRRSIPHLAGVVTAWPRTRTRPSPCSETSGTLT